MSRNAWRHTELELLRALKRLGYASSRTLAKALGYSHHKWVDVKLKELYENRRVYIADYEKQHIQGPWRRVYALRQSQDEAWLSGEEDAPMPKPQTGSQKTAAYRQRKRLRTLLLPASQGNDVHL